MPTTQQQRERLVNLLKELFQLDQPDLDFGFWRIMHAKADKVSEFLDRDLLSIIEAAFGRQDAARRAELEQAYQQALQQARDFGAPEPEKAPAAVKAKAVLGAHAESANAEAEVYDQLYRFFERYYEGGDFLSRRYYSAETEGKAAAYAIPYDGSDVHLHWANADQYYIKTAEYFTDFSFDPTKAAEVKDQPDLFTGQAPNEPIRVHFRVIAATEGEHGIAKSTDEQKRFFLVHTADPISIENGELIVRWEYRPDPEKGGQEGRWQATRNEQAVQCILAALDRHSDLRAHRYAAVLRVPAPTDKQKDRPLLAKYAGQYTARNTMDYFIHKDLGGFLRRELDFYIKNEIMRLDNLDRADALRAEAYLDKIRVLRQIARQIIDFLGQLEDFQKKLWLKKKFVVDTNYCITMGEVPEVLYPEIATNEAQREEWVRLFTIDDIKTDPGQHGYSTPLTVQFLKENSYLVLDTKFFGQEFKDKLVSLVSSEAFDGKLDGVLVCSENFQALNLLQARYMEQVESIYIDPPYNTDASSILYKNDYKDSSWLSLIKNRLVLAAGLMTGSGVVCFAIDDEEVCGARKVLAEVFAKQIGVVVVRSNPQSRKARGKLSPMHEYALFYGKSTDSVPGSLEVTEKRLARYPFQDSKGHYAWLNLIRTGTGDRRVDRPTLYYPIFVDKNDGIRIPPMTWSKEAGEYILHAAPNSDEVAVYPIVESDRGVVEKRWHRGYARVTLEPDEYRVRRDAGGKVSIDFKTRIDEDSMPGTWWDNKEYASANYGAVELKALFGENPFDFPKALHLVVDCLKAANASDTSIVVDFFGGSGTTGHAVIDLNREDGGNRKYVLVEMGGHFDAILKARIQKVVYSKDWKDGKPVSRDTGIRHIFKYIRIESYEDCLNNLVLAEDRVRENALAANPGLRRDYMLKYMLDVETRGSASLLNIDRFTDPTAYTLRVKKPSTDEYVERPVDLIETFNYLIGLRVEHMAAPETLAAKFVRPKDGELPDDQHTRLVIDGKLKRDANGAWWFRRIEGWVPKNSATPNDGQREKVLIIWRKLTGDLEQDNAVLDEYCLGLGINTLDFEYDTIYVNGSNNLPNLKRDEDRWKVRLIEEDFHRLMWDVEDA